MATTTATSHQQRYQDFTGIPEITNNSNSEKGERRDYMAQANKNSSRQTMTTVGSSSRFSNNHSELERHTRLLDSSTNNAFSTTPNSSSKSIRTHEERERQRRAEENAAFVKMLEEESFMLQGGRLPKKQDKERRDRSSSADLDAQAFPHPSNSFNRGRPMYQNHNASYSSTRSGKSQRSSAAARYQQQKSQQQQQQQQFRPRDLYSPYNHIEEDDEDDLPRRREEQPRYRDEYHHHASQPQRHDRDIPLELTIPNRNSPHREGSNRSKHSTPGFVPPANPLMEQQQTEFELNMNEDETRRDASTQDRRHPSQLRLLRRQPNQRAISVSPRPQHQGRREYQLGPPPNPPNMMSLEQAIHSLEMEEKGIQPPHYHQQQQQQQQQQQARRELPDDYDAILGGSQRHHSHRRNSGGHHRRNSDDDRRYRPRSPARQQQKHPQEQEIVLDHYHGRGDQPPPPQAPPHHPQAPPHHPGSAKAGHHKRDSAAGGRLMMPVEFVEFPTDWDGREIEPTEDNELLDRDEDEYYRRRAAYRQQQQQQQQQQQSLQSLQSQSLQSQSMQSQSINQQHRHRDRDRDREREREPVRRVHSTLSRESMPYAGNYASDMYSQTMALSGRRVPMQIEVSPGVSMPFRGSEETWEAIALNRIVKTSCLGCSIQLYCVEDAELVVCPDCQTMSPAHTTEDPKAKRTGLGLGFKEEQLVQWRNA